MKLLHKLKEALISVAPVSAIVLILLFSFGVDKSVIINFVIGFIMIVAGITLFSLGVDISMITIGENIGSKLINKQKLKQGKSSAARQLVVVMIISLILGIAVTVAEPDLWVLAGQLEAVFGSKLLLVFPVAVGVGFFLIISVLRGVFGFKLNYLLLGSYALVFILAIILQVVNPEFLAVAFDSGGVTTGPITVPFVMAFGIGIASVRGDNKAEDNFGIVALCSVGPLIAVMLLGLFFPGGEMIIESSGGAFGPVLLGCLQEVSIAIAPVVAVFLIFQFAKLRLPKKKVAVILSGLLYVYLGLIIFLTGVKYGFSEAGSVLGHTIANSKYSWLLMPLGVVVGFFIVFAEPAVHVLTKQVEEMTTGTIKRRSVMLALMFGMAVALLIGVIRAMYGVSLWWFIAPGYALALALTFAVPKVFTAIAFDSGGVASGPMASTFILPLIIGVADALGRNVLTDAFGTVALIAMTPLLTIQILGLVGVIKSRRAARNAPVQTNKAIEGLDLEIIEFDE